MNLNQLEYFIELADQKNFTKAAEDLFVSQSTISKSIRALEEEYGVTLIDRNAKKFQLTTEGEIFYKSARQILLNYNEETMELHSMLKSKKGTLCIGIPPVTITACFSPIIYQYRHRYPDIHLKISEVGANNVRNLLADGTLDLGAVINPFDDDDFVAMPPLVKSEAVLLVPESHRLAKQPDVRFAELKGERFMILTSDYMLHDIIINDCLQSGFTPDIQFESSQWDLLVEMVAMNQGISILPKPIVDKFWYPQIRAIHLKDPVFPWEPVIIYRKDKFITSPMQYFLDTVETATRNYSRIRESTKKH